MQRSYQTTNPVIALRLLYRSFFSQATKRNWLDDVISLEEILPAVKQALTRAELPVEALENCERRYLADTNLHSFTSDFFDFVAFLRSNFHGVPGTPGALICKAVINKLAESWETNFSPELLQVAKGQVQHLADGLAPKELGEHELACLMLRPAIVPGLMVVHVPSGRFGKIVHADADGPVIWKPLRGGGGNIEEPDIFAMLATHPAIDKLPLASSDPFPRVTADDVWAEFKNVFPY